RQFPEYHAFLGEVFAHAGATPRIAEEHESGASLVAGVEAGYGVALLAESLTCSIGNRLKLIPFQPELPPLIVGAAYPKTGFAPAADRFLRTATEAVATITPQRGRRARQTR
ncbi:MAG TPA: LysR substrate-binding domain-containing protein, partial [Opitutaceae bacterium]|nr:LysR substrate-binding domain-containing protein [Opitutaceae bacterium]